MKEVQITNHNNKLMNEVFIHIASAPDKPILESELPKKVLIVENTRTGMSLYAQLEGKNEKPLSFEAEMFDFVKIRADQLSSIFTLMSHGVTYDKFLEGYPAEKELAIYCYRKCQK